MIGPDPVATPDSMVVQVGTGERIHYLDWGTPATPAPDIQPPVLALIHGIALTAAPDGTYLRFGKSPTFAADVVPVAEIDLAEICADWDGVKCVYRIDARAAQALRARPPRIDRET